MVKKTHLISSKDGKATRFTRSLLATSISAFLLACGAADAQDFDGSKYILGDWNGQRAALHDEGVDLKLGYFSQLAHNVSGGDHSDTAYADQFFLGGYFDLEKLVGWKGAEVKVEITNRNGDLINNVAGMPFLLQSQQIFGRGNVTRLTQLSLTQNLLDDHLSVKLGRIYPSADFFAQSCAFQHLTFCSGGSSNYISSNWYGDPLSAPGARVVYTPDEKVFIKFGAYDANPANTSTDQGFKLTTTGGEHGTLLVGEIEYKAEYANGLDGDYRFGVVRSSIDKSNIVNSAGYPTSLTNDSAAIESSDNAFYVNLEQQMTHNANGGGLRVFASLIHPDNNVSAIGDVIAVGGFITVPFASRPGDRVGLAFGRNGISEDLTNAQRNYNAAFPAAAVDVQEYEYPIELNYNFAVTNGVEIMPSIQYVINPNGVKDADDAVVLGLQFNLNL